MFNSEVNRGESLRDEIGASDGLGLIEAFAKGVNDCARGIQR